MNGFNRLGIVKVTEELIRESLHLPESSQIVGIMPSENRHDVFILKVYSPEFKPVKKGLLIPEISPTFTTHEDGSIDCDWNLNGEL